MLSAAAMLPLVSLALRVLGFQRVQAVLRRWSAEMPAAPENAAETAQHTAEIVNAAANRGFIRANCLKRSLVLWYLLRRRGIVTDLRIGVRRGDNGFEAHAWIEYAGVVINDNPRYVALFAPFKGDMMASFTFVK